MKKYLFGLLTFILIGLINFGYCIDVPTIDTVDNYDGYYGYNRELVSISSSQGDPTTVNISSDYDFVCIRHVENTAVYFSFDRNTWNGVGVNAFTCIPAGQTIYMYGNSNAWFYYYKQGVGVVPGKLTSLQCQTEYGLVDPSNIQTEIRVLENNNETTTYYLGYGKYATIDLNGNDYLQYPLNGNYTFVIDSNSNNNGNCTGSINTGDIQWSALYINQIQHVSAPVINITIPEEFSWDYTSDSEEFNLDIEGYNVDTDYIEGIINLQNTKPNEVDFNNVIQGIIPLFVPGLVIILFIYFVFRFLKKIF